MAQQNGQRSSSSEHAERPAQAERAGLADTFHRFAHKSAEAVGSGWAFLFAVAVILGWIVTGPIFHFSDTWQLIINTATTIVTFLMVFLIQNTQNRDARAIHLKLDELIWAVKGARNRLVDLEELSDKELARLEEEFKRVKQRGSETPASGCQTQPEEMGVSDVARHTSL